MDLPYHVDARSVADAGSELQIQSALRKAVRKVAPQVRLVAVPNGGQRTAWAAMQAKREGLAKGFVDLLALAPEGKIAFLEMKARDGSLSEDQLDWLGRLHGMGHHVGVFRSVRTALLFLHQAGFPFICSEEALAA